MTKAYKIIAIFTIVLMLSAVFSNVFAVTPSVSIDKVETEASKADTNKADDAMSKIGGTIIKYITNAAIIVSVVMIAILGIKYMLGSSEEKAEYKKSMVPLLVGAILVFGAGTIARIFLNLANAF